MCGSSFSGLFNSTTAVFRRQNAAVACIASRARNMSNALRGSAAALQRLRHFSGAPGIVAQVTGSNGTQTRTRGF